MPPTLRRGSDSHPPWPSDHQEWSTAVDRRLRPPGEPTTGKLDPISLDDYLFYVDEALDGMIAIVTELGDGLANTRIARDVYEELAQHRGQMEGHRDVLLTSWARTVP
jgi:hypothetical protein